LWLAKIEINKLLIKKNLIWEVTWHIKKYRHVVFCLIQVLNALIVPPIRSWKIYKPVFTLKYDCSSQGGELVMLSTKEHFQLRVKLCYAWSSFLNQKKCSFIWVFWIWVQIWDWRFEYDLHSFFLLNQFINFYFGQSQTSMCKSIATSIFFGQN
jgi:hypothetical protein